MNSHRVNGAAANMFQKKAMGKFLMIVPTQIAGSCVGGCLAKITLNRIDATMLMVGHMTPIVPA